MKFKYIAWTVLLFLASFISSLLVPQLVSSNSWFAFILGFALAGATFMAWIPWIKTSYVIIVEKYA